MEKIFKARHNEVDKLKKNLTIALNSLEKDVDTTAEEFIETIAAIFEYHDAKLTGDLEYLELNIPFNIYMEIVDIFEDHGDMVLNGRILLNYGSYSILLTAESWEEKSVNPDAIKDYASEPTYKQGPQYLSSDPFRLLEDLKEVFKED